MACSTIVDQLYGANGLGIDLAYSGNVTEPSVQEQIPVPEPGVLGLLAIGLVGLRVYRRRPKA